MKRLYITSSALLAATSLWAAPALHIPMDLSGDALIETVSGNSLTLHSLHGPENIAGAAGNALRFDGYTTYAEGTIPAGDAAAASLTISMWVAPQTYPIVKLDQATEETITLAGTYSDESKSGWEFGLGYNGRYLFNCFSQGWKVSVVASDLLPCYEWSLLTAVVDGAAKKVYLYRNGIKVGEGKCMGTIDNSATDIIIGKSRGESKLGVFNINTFNGLIDDITISEEVASEAALAALKAENPADLAVPASRFASDLLRPHFHGMPDANWTNESHGMTYADGRYHVFFQKNANGPYMARLHWGHISSPDLINWREEKIAIAPGEWYDIKGCWSGAVFSDDIITGGRPTIIYTGVDYARAMISMATPDDASLSSWSKADNNPIIDGRPDGLSDDFRDPYFFRNGSDAYIIVGSSKDGIGTTTLHKYNPADRSWSRDGKLFFTGSSASSAGTFWEMPNVTAMENGKWLFTTTPLGTSTGVHTMYWTGSINADGTFAPDNKSTFGRNIELISRDGFGLLSPTIFQKDGKTIALGIVPDKLPGETNYELGWAHCYSLPREWSLDSEGNLIQKPYTGLTAMRGNKSFAATDMTLNGNTALDGIEGRRLELLGKFKVGANPFGFNIFKGSHGEGKITYNPADGTLTVDFTSLPRISNDTWCYNGLYTATLERRPAKGEEFTLNVFVDGSILDIFVNNRYATSIRVFPTDYDANGVEVFGHDTTATVQGWELASTADVGSISSDLAANADTALYSLTGTRIAGETPDSGIYIRAGKKILIK